MAEMRFDCAICRRDTRDPWHSVRKGRDRLLPPLCHYCERTQGVALPSGGSFRDRRLALQLIALADALQGEAASIQWRKHGQTGLRQLPGVR